MTPILENKHYNRPSVFEPASLLREAAALYALAEAKAYPIICFAHVTNQMGVSENDFEKGASDGNTAFVHLISIIAQTWRANP